MASHGDTGFSGPDSMDALIADRQRMWSGFTGATMGAAIFVALVLIGMAVFLL